LRRPFRYYDTGLAARIVISMMPQAGLAYGLIRDVYILGATE
jgi:hypothetical protein